MQLIIQAYLTNLISIVLGGESIIGLFNVGDIIKKAFIQLVLSAMCSSQWRI